MKHDAWSRNYRANRNARSAVVLREDKEKENAIGTNVVTWAPRKKLLASQLDASPYSFRCSNFGRYSDVRHDRPRRDYSKQRFGDFKHHLRSHQRVFRYL